MGALDTLKQLVGSVLETNGNVTGSGSALVTNGAAVGTASYYLGHQHRLIHRHVETVTLNPDQSARWELTIDCELPTSAEACYSNQDGRSHFLFPLLFLKKGEARTGFGIFAEDETVLPMPTRNQCDAISVDAALRASGRLLDHTARVRLPADLEERLTRIATLRPIEASAAVAELEQDIEPETFETWRKQGLLEDLRMLVEHSLTWVPIQGIVGERRVIRVRHDYELTARSFLRWNFGEIKSDRRRGICRLKRGPKEVLFTGVKRYGRRRYRISFPALGDRVAQPLAWMPIEFDFPTIYPRRCASYHFELKCPSGLTPRKVKVAADDEKRQAWERDADEPKPGGHHDRTTLRTGNAHVYLPGGQRGNDIRFRVTVGVGPGAFPVLWLLAGTITTILLWTLAAVNPESLAGPSEGKDQIAAGVLLVVPALLGGLIAVESRSVSRLLSGAKILLLVVGLSAVVAATELIRQPFGLQCSWAWTACAVVATAATVPLLTSWVLSVPAVWRQLLKLDTVADQFDALCMIVSLAVIVLAGLIPVEHAPPLRAIGGAVLLLLTAPLILLASNRAAVEISTNRRYLAVSAFVAAVICLILGCVELHAVTDRGFVDGFAARAEVWGAVALAASLAAGPLLSLVTKGFGPRSDEIDVSPEIGRALVAGDRIHELNTLLARQDASKVS